VLAEQAAAAQMELATSAITLFSVQLRQQVAAVAVAATLRRRLVVRAVVLRAFLEESDPAQQGQQIKDAPEATVQVAQVLRLLLAVAVAEQITSALTLHHPLFVVMAALVLHRPLLEHLLHAAVAVAAVAVLQV
jgi:hypothetical protein